jgi:diguanylate cyclase (GGDEF)-like protein
MQLSQQIKTIFMGNAPFTLSLMGVVLALLLTPIYLNGYFDPFDNSLQDRFYRLRLNNTKPHEDIVVVGITQSTINTLGFPLDRRYYIDFLKKVQKDKARAVGFNVLLSTPSKRAPETDQDLLKTVAQTPNVVMPFFHNYAERKSLVPMPELVATTETLGNVSTYRGDVAHHIEAQMLNQNASPRQVLFPMGVELARLYLKQPAESLYVENQKLYIGPDHHLNLEGGDLIRIAYQGPPGYFKPIPFEEIIQNPDAHNFKDKIVFMGAFSLTLGDVTNSPYGDQVSNPMRGVEIQAHIAQSVLKQNSLYHIPESFVLMALMLLAVCSGIFLSRFPLIQQLGILAILTAVILAVAYTSFVLGNIILDTGVMISFFALLALGQTTLLNLRSYIAINDQIGMLQAYDQKLPEVPASRRLENVLTSLFYISQADWVAYRRVDHEKNLLQLHDVKSSHQGSDADDEESEDLYRYRFSDLPPYYPLSAVSKLSTQRIIPLEHHQLPAEIREAYKGYTQGHFVFMPIYGTQKQLLGMFELYYGFVNADDIQNGLLEELRDVAAASLAKYEPGEQRSRDLVSGVEEKIRAMNRLISIREVETAFFSTVLESTTNPVVVCDQIGEIRFYNDNFLDLLYLDAHADITSASIQELMSQVFQILPQQWQEIWMTTLQRRKQKEVQVNTERGVYHLTLTPVFGQQSEVTGVVMILTDVTQLHRQANYDKLTGLYNRRYFDELMMKEFQRSLRVKEQVFALLLMDVDHFKKFNDTYGHQVGDQVLASFGQLLNKTARRTDMAVRYGGEEMAIILPDTTADNAAILAEKIRRAVEALQLYDLDGKPIQTITASIGVAEFNANDKEPDDILKRADDALYKCKDAGRNCIHIHHGHNKISKYMGRPGTRSTTGPLGQAQPL